MKGRACVTLPGLKAVCVVYCNDCINFEFVYVCAAIQNEFHGCQSDARLCREICRGVVAALKTFVARVEGSVVVNSFATAIPDHFQRTGAQRHNHALLSRLTQVGVSYGMWLFVVVIVFTLLLEQVERALEEFCAGQEPLVQGIVTEAIRPAISSINTQIGSILVV